MRFARYLLIALVISLMSCSQNKPYVKTVFEGEWQEVYSNMDLAKATDIYKFAFRSDSFYLVKHKSSDVADFKCHPRGAWDEFYSGIFTFDKDSIYLKGSRTDSANKEVITSECIKPINIHSAYKYQFRHDTLVFIPVEEYRYTLDYAPAGQKDSLFKKYEERLTHYFIRDKWRNGN